MSHVTFEEAFDNSKQLYRFEITEVTYHSVPDEAYVAGQPYIAPFTETVTYQGKPLVVSVDGEELSFGATPSGVAPTPTKRNFSISRFLPRKVDNSPSANYTWLLGSAKYSYLGFLFKHPEYHNNTKKLESAKLVNIFENIKGTINAQDRCVNLKHEGQRTFKFKLAIGSSVRVIYGDYDNTFTQDNSTVVVPRGVNQVTFLIRPKTLLEGEHEHANRVEIYEDDLFIYDYFGKGKAPVIYHWKTFEPEHVNIVGVSHDNRWVYIFSQDRKFTILRRTPEFNLEIVQSGLFKPLDDYLNHMKIGTGDSPYTQDYIAKTKHFSFGGHTNFQVNVPPAIVPPPPPLNQHP